MIDTNIMVQNLQNPKLYPHPVNYFKILETHISYVILTGEVAYKIKKPLALEFLDFSTLEKRKFFCEKELKLNRSFDSTIYQEVVAIYGSVEQPSLIKQGPVIEYALKMREFPQHTLLTHLLDNQQLIPSLIDQLAEMVAKFHLQAPSSTDRVLGTPEQLHHPVQQNFDQIRGLLTEPNDQQQLSSLESWANIQYQQLYQVFLQRKQQGFIRACHGDIHLENIIYFHHQLHIFDCIEFNEEFRWIDTLADIGFLMMDLMQRQRPRDAYRLINHYLEITGDYKGIPVLAYYISYRAVVRAKISLFRLHQPHLAVNEQQAALHRYRGCMTLTEECFKPKKPALIIMHGFSASGKSTLAKALAADYGAIRIRADAERQRLYKGGAFVSYEHIYSAPAIDATYQHLAELSKVVINAGYTTIVDATFLKRQHRQLFEDLAEQLQIPFIIIDCQAPTAVLRQSLLARRQQQDLSEATLDVLKIQLTSAEVLLQTELKNTIGVMPRQPNQENTITGLIQKIKNRVSFTGFQHNVVKSKSWVYSD